MIGILIIAHAPLASALRQCVLHVFPEAQADVLALDVQPNVPPEETLASALQAMAILATPQYTHSRIQSQPSPLFLGTMTLLAMLHQNRPHIRFKKLKLLSGRN